MPPWGMTVTSDGDLAAAAETVGFPLLVKAAFGGGGRGMPAGRRPGGPAGGGPERTQRSGVRVHSTRVPRAVRHRPRGARRGAGPRRRGRRAPWFTCSSASAPSSVATRRSWRSARHQPWDARLRAALAAMPVTAGQAIGYRRGHRRVRAGPHGSSTSWMKHPAAGRDPGHRGGYRPGPGGANCGSPKASRCRWRPARRKLTATPSRSVCTPRTSRPGSCPSRHPHAAPLRDRRRPGSGWRTASARMGAAPAAYYDAMLAKVIAYGRTRGDAVRAGRALERAEIHGVTTNRYSPCSRRSCASLISWLCHPTRATSPAYRLPALAAPATQATATHALAAGVAGAGGTAPRRRSWARCRLAGATFSRGVERQRVTYTAACVVLDMPSPTASAMAPSAHQLQRRAAQARASRLFGDRVDLEIDGIRREYRIHQGRRRGVR